MRNIFFKCGDGFCEAHPEFFSCHQWREAAAEITNFTGVVLTAAPFFEETPTSVVLDVYHNYVKICSVNRVLAKKYFEAWPAEGDFAKMLFSMLPDIVH